MEFEERFRTWLRRACAETIPDGVQAFMFNLNEYAELSGVKFGIDVIGSGSFDPDDSDWACEELWVPATRCLEIPLSFSGSRWETCLSRSAGLVLDCLQSDRQCQTLKRGKAIGIGFVDGDLEVIWRAEKTT